VCDQLSLLTFLKSSYGVQPCVTEAVNGEFLTIIESRPQFLPRREQGKKAFRSGSLVVLSAELLDLIFGNVGATLMRRANDEGQRLYNVGLDRGEAFSVAAAVCLNFPVVTNDGSALRRLERAREAFPEYCLRFWDLIVFSYQAGRLDLRGCDKARQSLERARERTIPCFSKQSVDVGLKDFFPRLVDGTRPALRGCGTPQVAQDRELKLTPRLASAASVTPRN
jgi:hypothetical protein